MKNGKYGTNVDIVNTVHLNFFKKQYMSRVMRKPAFCIFENKDADQLRGNCTADQRLCFCYMDSTIPLFPKSEISSLLLSSVVVSPVCVGPGRKPRRPGPLTTRLIYRRDS